MKLFKKVKKIHFVGIGGAGMIGIARVLLKKGYKISGSDVVDSSDLQKLRKDGAKVFIGHKKENIKDSNLLVKSINNMIPPIIARFHFKRNIPWIVKTWRFKSELIWEAVFINISTR